MHLMQVGYAFPLEPTHNKAVQLQRHLGPYATQVAGPGPHTVGSILGPLAYAAPVPHRQSPSPLPREQHEPPPSSAPLGKPHCCPHYASNPSLLLPLEQCKPHPSSTTIATTTTWAIPLHHLLLCRQGANWAPTMLTCPRDSSHCHHHSS